MQISIHPLQTRGALTSGDECDYSRLGQGILLIEKYGRHFYVLFKKKTKYHIAAALLTAVLLCQVSENFNKNSNLLAWWGTIYPQFCFMEAPGTEEGQKAEPRFHFWIVDTLNALM